MRGLGRFSRKLSHPVVTRSHQITPAALSSSLSHVGHDFTYKPPSGVSHTAADPAIYEKEYRESLENPTEYWARAAEKLSWQKKWDKVLDNSNPPFTKWFTGGKINTCYNAVDRHIENGFGDQTAIIYDSPVTDTIKKYSFKELHHEVSRLAGVLVKHGVQRGDRVLIYMPMIPEAMFTVLACARLGALHSLVFGGFASKELATRINHAKPKVVVSANGGIEPGRVIEYKPLLDTAIEISDYKPPVCIICNREYGERFTKALMIPGRDYDYYEEMAGARGHDAVPIPATDPIYLLYTSGTTGTPKAVVRPNAGHAVVLNWSMEKIYGMKPHEVWFAASDLGWVVGHSYIVYAPLLHCNTTILFEGKPIGTPDPSTYYRILHDHEVSAMFVAPTAMRALRREDPHGEYSKHYTYDKFRYMFVAGEHCDHETMEWIRERFNKPVLDNWWQTETGSAITSTCVGMGNDLYPPAGVAGKPVPGWNVQIVDQEMKKCEDYELGNIVVKLPLPPATFMTLWESEERFKEVYFEKFPGYYDTADSGYRDEFGNIAIMARTDDVINVAGHRLSTGQLEEAILEHDSIAESAVVGLPDKTKGHIPLGLAVLTTDYHPDPEQLKKEVKQVVRDSVGAIASLKDVIIVKKLPKTRSGKIARSTIAAMVSGKPYKIPVTIEDASVYPHLAEELRKAGHLPEVPIEEEKK